MDLAPYDALAGLLVFVLMALGAFIIPKPPQRKPPDMTAEIYDRRRP